MLLGQRCLIASAAEYVHNSVRKYARCFVIVFPVAFQDDLVNQTPIKSLEIKRNILNPFQSSHDANRFLRLSILSATFPFRSSLNVNSNLLQGNDIRLLHFPSSSPFSASEPYSARLLESSWVRQDGGRVDREHLLMALAAVEHVLVRANLAQGVEEAG